MGTIQSAIAHGAAMALAAHCKLAMAVGLGDLQWRPWLLRIWSAFVGGGAGAVAATFANVSIDSITHTPLSLHQVAIRAGLTFLLAGALHLAVFLSSQPAPPEGDDKKETK